MIHLICLLNEYSDFTIEEARQLPSRCHVMIHSQETPSHGRRALVCNSISAFAVLTFNCILTPSPVLRKDESNDQEVGDQRIIGAIKSLFDPNEKTKSRKVLPKAYLNSEREESDVEFEKAIRSLASFYSKAGPSAPLPEEVKTEILNDLNIAEAYL
ncbi:Photosystem II Pbs27 [Dillenia turbinata]|uniref:Photosystem II Pbs27 n=1 Tax=Dillenia turbinata TaxID=194707 RepID=A0AAN8UEF9_9MAGN